MTTRYTPRYRPAADAFWGLDWRYVEAPANIAHMRPDLPRSSRPFGIVELDAPLSADEIDRRELDVIA